MVVLVVAVVPLVLIVVVVILVARVLVAAVVPVLGTVVVVRVLVAIVLLTAVVPVVALLVVAANHSTFPLKCSCQEMRDKNLPLPVCVSGGHQGKERVKLVFTDSDFLFHPCSEISPLRHSTLLGPQPAQSGPGLVAGRHSSPLVSRESLAEPSVRDSPVLCGSCSGLGPDLGVSTSGLSSTCQPGLGNVPEC